MPRALTISFFLLVISGILYLGNIVVYETVAHVFGITGQTELFLLGCGLGILSASFIIATIVGTWHYNVFTRVYYTISSTWMGTLVYLFIASLIVGVLSVTWPSSAWMGSYFFVAAFLVSIYGIFHAQNIVVTPVPIFLPNLPPSWKGRKMVWISDVHLGQIQGLKFAQKIVALVSTLSPDIIFVGGDLYDGSGAPDIEELTVPLNGLRAPFGTFFVTGNHEEYGDRKRFLSAIESTGMRILQNEMVEIDGLQLVGVDYRNASDGARFRKLLSELPIDREKTSILLKHEPKDLAIAHEAGIDFQISGHTHEAQLWPLGYIARLTYKGYAYGLHRYKDMRLYISSGTGTWGPPMREGTKSEIVLFTVS